MKIVIPGGSGQVGTILARAFHEDRHEVVVLCRHPPVRPWRVVRWDGATIGAWAKHLDGCDAVINLAGRNVNCRYPVANRRDIVEAIRWLIRRDDISGIVNVAAPNPLPNAAFMRVLRDVSGACVGLPAHDWMLEIGAVFIRTETELILKSRRVVPGRLLANGF